MEGFQRGQRAQRVNKWTVARWQAATQQAAKPMPLLLAPLLLAPRAPLHGGQARRGARQLRGQPLDGGLARRLPVVYRSVHGLAQYHGGGHVLQRKRWLFGAWLVE